MTLKIVFRYNIPTQEFPIEDIRFFESHKEVVKLKFIEKEPKDLKKFHAGNQCQYEIPHSDLIWAGLQSNIN